MFGIGLPEMIVILAVALIVVGPEKLPDLARSVAKWTLELKKTVNQVKASLEEEDNLIGSVKSDLKKTADDLKGNLLEPDANFTWKEPAGGDYGGAPREDVVDMDDLKPVTVAEIEEANQAAQTEAEENDAADAEVPDDSQQAKSDKEPPGDPSA